MVERKPLVLRDDGSLGQLLSGDVLPRAPQPALRNFHAALANRFYAPCNVVVVGSSSSEGVGATAYGRGYVNRLRSRLRTAFPVPGVVGGENFYSAWGSPAAGASPSHAWPVTKTGSPGNSNSTGFALKSVTLNASGQALTLPFTGTSVEVWFSIYGGGSSFSVTIDDVVVASSVSTDGAVNRHGLWASGPLAPGPHSIVVTWVSGASPAYVRGFAVHNGDENSGIRLYNGAQASLPYATFDSQSAQWVPTITALQPSLVILQNWNEYTQNLSPSAMTTSVQSIVSKIRGACTISPSFVLTSGPVVDSTSHAYPWTDYQAAWRQIAATDTGGPGGASGVALFDLAQRLPSPIVDNVLGLYQSDLLHATDKGHAMWADALAAFLAPS